MTGLAWHDGLNDVVVRVMDCNHDIRWAAGRLAHEDLVIAAEQVLGALGGEECRCAAFLRAWNHAVHDVSVLALAPRSSRDTLGAVESVVSRFGQARCVRDLERLRLGVFARSPMPPEVEAIERAVHRWMEGLLLMAMPWDILQRLQAAAVHHALERWPSLTGSERTQLRVALHGRARAAIAATLPGPLRRLDLGICDPGPDRAAELAARPESGGFTVEGRLPVSWLGDVWGRDAAVSPSGRFVTSVEGVDAHGGLILQTHRW